MKRESIATDICRLAAYECYEQRNQVVRAGDIDIIAHHGGYVGFKDQPNSTGFALLNHRENNLVNYIRECPDLGRGNIKKCLVAAFEKLDKDLKGIEIESSCPPITLDAEEMWMTRFNSLVVIVDKKHGQVHVAGSGQVDALLLKPGSMELLTAEYYNALAELGREKVYRPGNISLDVVYKTNPWEEDENEEIVPRTFPPVDKQLFYYKHVPLQREHNHVILASEGYISGDLWLRTHAHYKYVSMVNLPEHFDTSGMDTITQNVVDYCAHVGRVTLLLVACLGHSHFGNRVDGKRNASHQETSHRNKQPKYLEAGFDKVEPGYCPTQIRSGC